MGQLIDHHVLRLARQNRVAVHLLEDGAAIGDLAQRNPFQVADQRRGLRALMGLDQAQYHVVILGAQLMGLFEHPVGLAHPGSAAQVNLELAPGRFGFKTQE